MQQRVAICRALLMDPPIILMDEPFGALDIITRERMAFELQKIWSANRNTVLFVTHSVSEAVLLSDTVVVMTSRPGRISEIVEIDLPRPRRKETLADQRFIELSRSEEHTSELQSLMRISYAVFCLKIKNKHRQLNPSKTKAENS